MEQPKFRGFSLETNSWHYGHGWFKCDYTEEYMSEKGIEDRAILHTESHPVECELKSMGRFVTTVRFAETSADLYEGDIVADMTDVVLEKKYQIIWDENGMFLFVPLYETDMGAINYIELEEIHGDNIYPLTTTFDNPELRVVK